MVNSASRSSSPRLEAHNRQRRGIGNTVIFTHCINHLADYHRSSSLVKSPPHQAAKFESKIKTRASRVSIAPTSNNPARHIHKIHLLPHTLYFVPPSSTMIYLQHKGDQPPPSPSHSPQGQSLSPTLTQVKYPTAPPPSPAPPGCPPPFSPRPDPTAPTPDPPTTSNSNPLPISGRTTSRAIPFSSSTRFSNRRRLSRLYKSGVSFRKRLHSSWAR